MSAQHDVSAPSEAHRERERIRALMLAQRPELIQRIENGPSGALVITSPTGHGVEIGRMRRRGQVRWMVVHADDQRVRVREPSTLQSVARTALAAADRVGDARQRTDAGTAPIRS